MEKACTTNDKTVEPETDRASKVKCLTKSEYNTMIKWIDSLINNNAHFILNKYCLLFDKALSRYTHLNENTVMSIVDSRVQHYVRQRHHRVFNNNIKNSSTSATITPNQSSSRHQYSRRSTNSTKTMYARYKELRANASVKSPLLTLANNVRMPAMLVAKVVLADRINEEKLKNCQSYPISDISSNSSIVLNDKNDVSVDRNTLDDKNNISADSNLLNENNISADSNLLNENNISADSNLLSENNISADSNLLNDSKVSSKDGFVNNSATTEIDSSFSVDEQLSQQLMWLTGRLRQLKSVSKKKLNQSANSSIDSSSCSSISVATNNLNLSTHQLATSTWLIDIDPQLAYHVYECSVVDGHYGSCVEFLKICSGKRYEQVLRQNMTSIATVAKSQTEGINPFFITENECRLRGLDMTPDMVLNEPIAISLSDDESNLNYDQKHIASNYVGGSDNAVRVLNWIESKAMFGCPEKLRQVMQRQLFPYWNRYGPGAVIFWFGYVLEDNEKDQNVSGHNSTTKASKPTKMNSNESTLNFWSKYCLLMDGFPAPSRIVMHNQKNNNRQNSTKKKNSTTAMTV